MSDLSQAVSIEDLRLIAKRRIPRAIFDFFDGGAEDEVTLRENRAAFERNPRLHLMQPTSRRLARIDQLIDEGFLVVSEEYRRWLADRRDRRPA